MPAASSGTLLVMAFGGTDPGTGRPFVASELAAGGMGARPAQGRHRRHRDRRHQLHEHPGGVGRDELPAAHPPGRPVDGLGRRRAVPRAASGSRRSSRPPPPTSRSPTGASASPRRRGGSTAARPARAGRAFIVRRDGTREELPSKKMIVLHPGDQLWEYIAGRRRATATRSSAIRTGCSPTCWTARSRARPPAPSTASCSRRTATAVDHDATKECREAMRRAARAHRLGLRPGRRARPRGRKVLGWSARRTSS